MSISSMARLTVITGPSGVGKGSLVKELISSHPEIWLSVSATTRAPRKGEENGKHYFFMEESSFDELVLRDGFIEWAEFAGNKYGTPREPVKKELDNSRPVLLEIELEGARQVRKSFPEAFQIFLSPPNFQELENRIRGRGTESEESIKSRLIRAKEELQAKNEFDAIVINGELNLAVKEVERLMSL